MNTLRRTCSAPTLGMETEAGGPSQPTTIATVVPEMADAPKVGAIKADGKTKGTWNRNKMVFAAVVKQCQARRREKRQKKKLDLVGMAQTPNNADKQYDYEATVSVLFQWQRTVFPRLVCRFDFLLYIAFFAILECLSLVYELPDIKDKWRLIGYPMALLTFSTVFYLNNTWTRFLGLYAHWNDMHVEVLEFTTLAMALTYHNPASTMASDASRYMLSSLYLNLYIFQEEDGEDVLERTGLLEDHEMDRVLDCADEGYNASDMLDVWTLLQLHRCNDLKAGELTQLKGKVLRLSKHCRDIKAKMDMPVPHEYYHIVNFMLLISMLMLAYLLAIQASFYGGFLFLSLLVAFLGLRELATDFCDPFGNLPSDFPVERRLAETRAAVSFLLKCPHPEANRTQFEDEEADRKLCSLMSMFGKKPGAVEAAGEATGVTVSETDATAVEKAALEKFAHERAQHRRTVEMETVTRAVGELFARYDLDGSGSINSQEEAQMLALNVSYKLSINLDRDRLASMAGEQHAAAMSLDDFTQWFYADVLEGSLKEKMDAPKQQDEVEDFEDEEDENSNARGSGEEDYGGW